MVQTREVCPAPPDASPRKIGEEKTGEKSSREGRYRTLVWKRCSCGEFERLVRKEKNLKLRERVEGSGSAEQERQIPRRSRRDQPKKMTCSTGRCERSDHKQRRKGGPGTVWQIRPFRLMRRQREGNRCRAWSRRWILWAEEDRKLRGARWCVQGRGKKEEGR